MQRAPRKYTLPTVVRVRRPKPNYDVYVGREYRKRGWNMKRSDWHNPYFVQMRDVMQACVSCADYLFKSNEGKTLLKRMNELGCWCNI